MFHSSPQACSVSQIENSSAVYVAGNRIENNWAGLGAGYGGGVWVTDSDAHLARNTIISNTTGTINGYGGGVCILGTTPVTLSNNLIARNDASTYGGGVFTERSTPASQAILVNNTIVDNGDTGIVAREYAILTMTNNIVAGHTAGIIATHPASATVSADHNLFWNAANPIIGSNAILEDPLLTADYHLRVGSPAIDAGLTVDWLTVDLEGNSRPQGSKYDIGAFEGEGVWWKVYLPLVLR